MDAHFKIILAMLSIHFIFSGLNTFIGNQGYEGTAMYLCVNETTNIQYTGSIEYILFLMRLSTLEEQYKLLV